MMDGKCVKGRSQRKSKSRIAMLGILLFFPVLLVFGAYLLENRQYYLIGFLMVVLVTIPFFLQFESREPKTAEIVTLACMNALAVASRVAFAPLPQVKPMLAVVVMAGVCYGAESGFLVGAMAALLSNFYFGQGLWTPYQMFGAGLVGCLAGWAFHKGRLGGRLPVCLYGALSAYALYGGVANLSFVLVPGWEITPPYVLQVYLTALPFDFIHAASTFLFLFILYRPITKVLRRVQIKYGILDVDSDLT